MTINPQGPIQGRSAVPATPATPREDAPSGDVEISYNAQDKTVFEPGTTVIKGVQQAPTGPAVEKAVSLDQIEPQDGKYVFDKGDARFHQAVAFSAVAKTIEVFEGALGTKIKWAFDKPAEPKPPNNEGPGNGGNREPRDLTKLGVHGDFGEDFNAFYAREGGYDPWSGRTIDAGSVNFFHGQDKVTGETMYSADSGEVVSHECGHALLDAVRPGYFDTWSPDPPGFHESFGDMVGLFMTLLDDKSRAKIIEQTGGDLKKPNIAAATGEELGIGINHYVGQNVTGGDFVRNAINKFTWVDPKTLPQNPESPDQLGSECHSWGQLFTGTMYDVVATINDRNLQAGMTPDESLKATGEECLRMYANLMKTAPQGDFTYKDMAIAFVQADKQYNDGKNADILTSTFKARKILPEDFQPEDVPAKIYSSVPAQLSKIQVKLDGPEFGKFSGAKVVSVKEGPFQDAEEQKKVRENIERLIKEGQVLYTEPNQVVRPKDLFKKDGHPYMGVARWMDGEMTIERVKIAT